LADPLITPENAAFVFIDYQPAQLAAVRSMDHALLLENAGGHRVRPGRPRDRASQAHHLRALD